MLRRFPTLGLAVLALAGTGLTLLFLLRGRWLLAGLAFLALTAVIAAALRWLAGPRAARPHADPPA